MLIIKIIVLLWVITGTLLGVVFCYSDKSDGCFDGLDNFTLIVTVLSMTLIGPPLFIYSVIKHHKRRG